MAQKARFRTYNSDSGNFKLTPQQIAEDPCAQALNRTHCLPGSGSCMACAGAVWANGTGKAAEAVRAQCSNPALPFPTDNKAAENWCGDGFSFFDWTETPVTEYWWETKLSRVLTLLPLGSSDLTSDAIRLYHI